jgi:hypothetical protein
MIKDLRRAQRHHAGCGDSVGNLYSAVCYPLRKAADLHQARALSLGQHLYLKTIRYSHQIKSSLRSPLRLRCRDSQAAVAESRTLRSSFMEGHRTSAPNSPMQAQQNSRHLDVGMRRTYSRWVTTNP